VPKVERPVGRKRDPDDQNQHGNGRTLISVGARCVLRDDAGWFAPGALPAGSGGLVTRALRDLVLFETKGTFALD